MAYNAAKRRKTRRARRRLLILARKQGFVAAKDARKVGGWAQHWYHLEQLVEAGHLRRTGHDSWVPIKKVGRLPGIEAF